MAEITYKIKHILENGTQGMFNYILFLQNPELNRIGNKLKMQLADWSAAEGEKALSRIPCRDCSVEDLALKMGVKRIHYINEGFGQDTVRAYYEPSSATIVVNTNSIAGQMRILEYYGLRYFSEYDILKMHLLHELFHHIEDKITDRIDALIKEKFQITGDLGIFRDIGAFGFVNAYLNTFPCQIIDFTWKCYFYPESIDTLFSLMAEWESVEGMGTVHYHSKGKGTVHKPI